MTCVWFFVGRLIGENARAPDFAHLFEEPLKVGVGIVELVDDDHAAETAIGGDLHHAAREEFDALGRIDDGGDGLDGVERREVLAEIVRIPRVSST